MYALVLFGIAAAALLVLMIVVPVGPALAILAITPFEGLPTYYLGRLGNIFTLVPIILFLVRTPTAAWLTAFFGTRVQLAAFLLLIGLVIPHILTADVVGGVPTLLIYGRKVVLFLLMGLFAWTFRSERWVDLAVKTTIMAAAIFTLISMLDFYFGLRLFPGLIEAVADSGASGVVADHTTVNRLRFRGLGLEINRTANWLILPTFFAAGWWMSASASVTTRIVALGAFIILLGALLGTVGRSAILGFAAGTVLLLPRVMRRFGQASGAVVGILATIAGLYFLMAVANVGDLLSYRFAGEVTTEDRGDRMTVWLSALDLFARSPIWGTGADIIHLQSGSRLTAHSVFIKFLAEAGLLGLLPFVALLAFSLRALTRRLDGNHERVEYWRPFVLAGFVALLVQNQFNDYPWERYLWMCFAYAAAVEALWSEARARARVEKRVAVANL